MSYGSQDNGSVESLEAESHAKGTVLLVEDDAAIRKVISRTLQKENWEVREAGSVEEVAPEMFASCDVAILDLTLPGMSGQALLERLKRGSDTPQVIMISAVGSVRDVVAAMKEGAFWFLQKPFDRDELLLLVQRACQYRESLRRNEILESHLSYSADNDAVESISLAPSAGNCSAAMRQLHDRLSRVARLEATVLLTGESGVGKSTFARALHDMSGRSRGPFIGVSCASLPAGLLESGLFGHERGAFTGAHRRRAGCIEVAQHGTLFLDEIGDLPLELQPKLLTFLEDRTFRRVGASELLKADVRVIAATNLNLEEMIQAGRFRPELYYRLAVLDIKLPSLRDRPEDIIEISKKVLARIARERGDAVTHELAPEVETIFRRYPWPGNIRELQNVLERATAFANSGLLQEKDFEMLLSSGKSSSSSASIHASASSLAVGEVDLDVLERVAIQEALLRAEGRKAEAAKLLGISVKSLYNKIARHGLRA